MAEDGGGVVSESVRGAAIAASKQLKTLREVSISKGQIMSSREKALWNMLEEIQAQVELPEKMDNLVTILLWGKRDRSDV